MCGHVEIGVQKDIKIITRDGESYKPKNNGAGNPGSILPGGNGCDAGESAAIPLGFADVG
ncbi:hypothetical protein [Mucilaginibacter sp. KACC 22063]|uniref:hypothetical protein n=1 Tax=Mucilaginibacter sp. KACC 22063 TaxID=3025666 RepID=UPI002366A90E|nr:hypothetical protein [Mucilaginibacter sp. KACC 22063]WDF57214.1 hypothetical protein PQ461_09125 [Mucilaginibacter sp. KACC 22063]